MPWILVLIVGCQKADRYLPAVAVDSTESVANGLVFIEGNGAFLGETDPDLIDQYDGDGEEAQTIMPASNYEIADYYIDRYPFPGIAGADWFTDGTRHNTIEALDATLADFGRRVCDIAELMYAAAGPNNHRYPYGDGFTVAH